MHHAEFFQRSCCEPIRSGRHKHEQHAIGGAGRDKHAAGNPDRGLAGGLFSGDEVRSCEHEPGASTLGKSRQRDVGIAAAQLVLCQEQEIGTVRTGSHRNGAIRLER